MKQRRIPKKKYYNSKVILSNMLKKLCRVKFTESQVESCMNLMLYVFQKEEEKHPEIEERDALLFTSAPIYWKNIPFSSLLKCVEILAGNRLVASDILFKDGHLCVAVVPAFTADQIRGYFKGVIPEGYI